MKVQKLVLVVVSEQLLVQVLHCSIEGGDEDRVFNNLFRFLSVHPHRLDLALSLSLHSLDHGDHLLALLILLDFSRSEYLIKELQGDQVFVRDNQLRDLLVWQLDGFLHQIALFDLIEQLNDGVILFPLVFLLDDEVRNVVEGEVV